MGVYRALVRTCVTRAEIIQAPDQESADELADNISKIIAKEIETTLNRHMNLEGTWADVIEVEPHNGI
jgi:hypothetical protein